MQLASEKPIKPNINGHYRSINSSDIELLMSCLGSRFCQQELARQPLLACIVLALALVGCDNRRTGLEARLERDARALLATGHSFDSVSGISKSSDISKLAVEKSHLKLGFIKLTDCAPLVIAKEKGFFADEGLQVELEAQSNWKVLLDRVIDGQLDGAHMLSGQPIGATIGLGTKSPIITAISLDYGGNAITVANDVWAEMQKVAPELAAEHPAHPITAAALKAVIAQAKSNGSSFTMGMVFPLSTHNYELRYWLAAAGINPGMYTSEDINGNTGADVLINVTPPPQMPSTLEAGTIRGYCVGEPWNQLAIAKNIGTVLITDQEIWKDNPEKVFGVTEQWNEQHPQTHLAILKALIRAGKWLDEKDANGEFKNREEAVAILSEPTYVGADREVIAGSMLGNYRYQKDDIRKLPEFVNFFDGWCTYPHYSDCIWYLTQMRRWGQISEPKPDQWYIDTAKQVYRPEIYQRAAALLLAEGKLEASEFPEVSYDGFREATTEFIDGKRFDGHQPNAYLKEFQIGNQN